MEKKVVAVVGGSRQLGSLVIDALVAQQHVARVVAIDTVPPISASAKIQAVELPRAPNLEETLTGCDAVIHTGELAALHLGISLDSMLKAAIHAGVPRIVCVTSMSAYGAIPDHPVPLVEDSPRRPPYDGRPRRGAFDAEATLDELGRVYPNVRIIRLRPGLIFGAGTTTLPARALRHGWCPVIAQAPATPLVWDEDVVAAVLLALDKDVHGAFNLAASETQPMAHLARMAGLKVIRLPDRAQRALTHGQGSGSRLLSRHCDPHWLAIADVSMYLSTRRAREELGWEPRYRTSPEVVSRYLATAPKFLDVRISTFFALMGLARYLPARLRRHTIAAGRNARIRLWLTGEDGGELGLVFEDGKPYVQRGPLHAPDCVVTMPAKLFMAMLAGQTSTTEALASGQLEVQESDHQRLAFELIDSFVGAIHRREPWARPARWMADWMRQGLPREPVIEASLPNHRITTET